MAGIQLSGLASGLDWQTLVTKLMAAERVPQDNLRTQQTTNLRKSSALDTLKAGLTDLQTSLAAFKGDTSDAFAVRTAKIGDSTSSWSANADAGTVAGTYQVTVSQLATKAKIAGVPDVGGALSATSDVSGLTLATLSVGTAIRAGDFTVNGARITVAATDSLQDVFNQISTKTGGTVTASYDPATDKIGLSGSSEIVLGSANDTSNFLGALQLFNNGTADIIPPKALGVVSLSAAIKNANLRNVVTGVDAGGNGSFAINGVSIAFNANTDSLQTVLARISASAAGVKASFDAHGDQFTLTNKTTGDVGIAVSEGSGGLLAALGLGSSATLVHGKNAQFSMDGGPMLTGTSNTLDATSHGLTGLAITATSATTQSVTVAGDTSGQRKKIEDFIAKFNAVQTYIDQVTKTTKGGDNKVATSLLSGNREVSAIATQLRSKIFAAVPGLTGSIQRLESLGIDFTSGTSQLTIKDSGKLDGALSNNGDDVRTLFSDASNGLAKRLNDFVTQVTGSTGSLATQSTSLASQNTSLTNQIAAMERTFLAEQNRLTSGFIQMESAQSAIQSQLAALNNAFGTSSSSSKR